MGDVNINLNENSNISTEYNAVLSQNGFCSYINLATRVCGNIHSCIDHIFLRKKLKTNILDFRSYIIHTSITDHFPVMLNISSNDRINNDNLTNNCISTINYGKMENLLKSEKWECVTESDNPQLAAQAFVGVLQSYMIMSTSTKNVKGNFKKLKPWITLGIINSIKYRDKLKKQLIRNFSLQKEHVYKNYRNTLKKIINNTKNDYYKNQINKYYNNTKKIYQIIRDATNEVGGRGVGVTEILSEGRDPFPGDKELANYCNEFFSTIGVNMAKKINRPNNPIMVKYNNKNSMYLKPVNESELVRHISSLKNNSAPGEDGISTQFIKKLHKYFLKPLVHIINLIFRTGTIPAYFKSSIVVPIFKSGNKEHITNYRPISFINNFSKLFEKVLKERLISYFKTNNILSEKQFGFVENMSTSDAMYEIISEITNSMNKGNKTLGIFLDLAKAFDTVPHDLLLKTLSHYGIRGPVSDVFESYLTGRQQIVRINNVRSDSRVITMGIPQGTVLGPILFITYLNPLLKELEISGSLLSYADDTVLVFSGNCWNEVRDAAVNGITDIKRWFDSFQLSLNLGKTVFISFSPTEKDRPNFSELIVNGNIIQSTDHVKYLGVIVDCHLKWNLHVEKITLSVKRLLHKFYILREFLNQKILISIYKSLVESIFRYGILVWGGMYKSALQPLNILQNYILKIIFRKPKLYHTVSLYSENILNIRCLFILTVSKYMTKLNQLGLTEIVTHNFNTRVKQKGNLPLPYNKKTLSLKSIVHLGPTIYNTLPLNIRQIKNDKSFNIKCAHHIFHNYDIVYSKIV